MSRPSLLPSRFDPRVELRASAARGAAAARGDDWGRPPTPSAGAGMGMGWALATGGGGGGRADDDRQWARVELQPQPEVGMAPVLYSYFAPSEQELPVQLDSADVFSPQWWTGAEYGERDYLFPGAALERSSSGVGVGLGASAAEAWASAWLWGEAAGDASMGPASDPYDAVALNASDESEAEEEEEDEEEEEEVDEERQSMFRVERDGPPRPKAPAAAAARTAADGADGADAAAIMQRAMSSPARQPLYGRRGRILDAGDPPLAFRMGSRRGPMGSPANAAASSSSSAASPPQTPTPPAATASDWTLRPKAERPEEEEDFIRCQQLSRCSDRPPCPGCLCFLCPGCSGPLSGGGGGGGEGDAEGAVPSTSPASAGVIVGGSSLPGPTSAPTVSPLAATASMPTTTSAHAHAHAHAHGPAAAPTALSRPGPASRKALWGSCRAVTSTRAF